MSKQSLTEAWSNWKPRIAPYILSGDIPILNRPANEKHIKIFDSWSSYYSSANFDKPGQSGVHLGLLPQPYCGDLKNAEVYVLLLNPGLHPTDYYGEYEMLSYKKAAIKNLKQIGNKEYPFIYLNPKFSWHGGYDWWHGKFSGVIAEIAAIKNVGYSEARQFLSKKVASIELFPYHSKSFKNHAWVSKLESVKLAKKYVDEYVMPKVEAGKAIVIVTRQASVWNLQAGEGVIVYPPGKARGASLGPASEGGRAVIERLSKTTT